MKKLTILLTLLCMPLMVGWSGSGEIEVFSTGIDGLVPAPGGTTGAFLMDDGTWGAGGTPPITTDLQINSLAVGPVAATGVAGEAKIGVIYPNAAADMKLRLLSDSFGFALQNTAGSDAFRFDLDGDDRKLSFLGGSNTGVLTWDDSDSEIESDSSIYINTINGYLQSWRCRVKELRGFNVNETPSATYGIAYAPMSAAPATPTTGFIIYCEQSTGDKITLWSSGNITRDVAQ